MKSTMQIVFFLDAAQRWRWQMNGSDGLAMMESCESYETYSLAVRHADEVCRWIPHAPVEFEVVAAPHVVGSTTRINTTFAAFRQVLDERGLEAALEVLNRQIPHRFSAVYALPDAQRLVNIAVVDKLGEPYPPSLQSVPYNQSFCQFAIRDGQFRTTNSALDSRLDGHAYQGVLNSYHAVPLVSAEGVVLGTLSHFDMDAIALDDDDFELLRMVAQAVVHCVPKPAATGQPLSSSAPVRR